MNAPTIVQIAQAIEDAPPSRWIDPSTPGYDASLAMWGNEARAVAALYAPVLADLTARAEADLKREQGRWQEAIRGEICKHCPDDKIDGAGCESGDPLDLTLTEVAQGIGHWMNAARQATARAEKAEADNAALRAELQNIEAMETFAKSLREALASAPAQAGPDSPDFCAVLEKLDLTEAKEEPAQAELRGLLVEALAELRASDAPDVHALAGREFTLIRRIECALTHSEPRTSDGPMDLSGVEVVELLPQQHSAPPWEAINMVHAEGRPMTPEEIGEYVANSVRKSMAESGFDHFLAVTARHDDGKPADVCLVGNGPRGPWNARLIAAAPDLLASVLAEEEADRLRDLIDSDWEAKYADFGALLTVATAAIEHADRLRAAALAKVRGTQVEEGGGK